MKPDEILLEFFKGYYATGEGGLDIGHAERECARAGLVKVFRYLADWYDGPRGGCPVCGLKAGAE